jgi:hypothetical protein
VTERALFHTIGSGGCNVPHVWNITITRAQPLTLAELDSRLAEFERGLTDKIGVTMADNAEVLRAITADLMAKVDNLEARIAASDAQDDLTAELEELRTAVNEIDTLVPAIQEAETGVPADGGGAPAGEGMDSTVPGEPGTTEPGTAEPMPTEPGTEPAGGETPAPGTTEPTPEGGGAGTEGAGEGGSPIP